MEYQFVIIDSSFMSITRLLLEAYATHWTAEVVWVGNKSDDIISSVIIGHLGIQHYAIHPDGKIYH